MIEGLVIVVTLGIIFMIFDEGGSNKGLMMFYFIVVTLGMTLSVILGTMGIGFIFGNIL